MAEFRKWRIEFESNESGVVDRRRVPHPPGYEPSAGREVVRHDQPRPARADAIL